MKKRYKNINNKFIAIGVVTLLTGATFGVTINEIVKNKDFSNNEIVNTSRNVETNQNLTSRAVSNVDKGFITGNVTPNNYGELALPEGKNIIASSSYEMQKICPVPGGWVVATRGNDGEDATFIEQNTGTIRWSNNYASRQNSKIITVQYDRWNDRIIVLRILDNYSIYVFSINPNTGNVEGEKLVYQGHNQEWLLNQRFDLVPVIGAESKWLMMPRAVMNGANRFDSRTKIITAQGSQFIVETVPNVTSSSSTTSLDYSIPAYGAFYNRAIDKIEIFCVEWYIYSKQGWISKYRIGDWKYKQEYLFQSTSDSFTDSNKLTYVSSRLKIVKNGEDSNGSCYVTFLYNNTPWSDNDDIGFYNTVSFSREIDNKNIFNKIQWTNINTTGDVGCDIDIINPYYYEGAFYGMVTYFKNKRSGKLIDNPTNIDVPYHIGAVRIAIKWVKKDNDTEVYSRQLAEWDKNNPYPTNDVIKLYTKGLKAVAIQNRSNHYVIPSYDHHIWGSFEFNARYFAMASTLPQPDYVINRREKLGRYAYWTRGTTGNSSDESVIWKREYWQYFQLDIPVSGVSNKSALDCSMEDARQLLNTITQKSTSFIGTVNWRANPAEDQNQDTQLVNGTKWSFYFYKGIAPFSVRLQNIFVEGVFTEDLWAYMMASGFKRWTTSLKPGAALDATTIGIQNFSPTDLANNVGDSKNVLVNYLRQNINEFWNDIPIASDFNPNEDLWLEIQNPNDEAKTADVVVHTKKWINEYNQLQSGDKTWTIPISGLRDIIRVVPEMAWNDLINKPAPSISELTSGELNNEVKQAIARPYRGDFIFNQNQLNILPSEISINSWEPIENNLSKVKINLTIRNANVSSIITGLRAPETTMLDVINANKPNELPDAQSEESLLAILRTEKDKVFANLPNGWEVNNNNVQITNINPDNQNGWVMATVKLLNIYSADTTLTKNVKFANFQNSTNSTILNSTYIHVKGIDNILANSITNLNNNTDENVVKIKNAVKEQISNPNGELALNDIELVGVNSNNVSAEIQVKIRLNNSKYLSNGVALSTYEFPPIVTIVGFKNKAPTEWSSNAVIYDTNAFGNMIASQYSEQQIKNYIWANKGKFFTNAPKELTKEGLVISYITANDAEGSLQFYLGLTKYYDDRGNLVDNPNGDSFKKRFTLAGFNKAGQPEPQPQPTNTTTINQNINVAGVQNVDPNSIDFNNANDQNVIKIKQAVIGAIQNASGTVEANDISFANPSVNTNDGSIRISITLNNSKYQENGVTKPSHTFENITLIGFARPNQSTTTSLSSIVNVNGVGDIDPSLVNFNNENDPALILIKEAIKNAIQNPASPVAVSDIRFIGQVVNPTNGTITVNVVLMNNKYQENGVTQSTHIFNTITLSGFKTSSIGQNTTTLSRISIDTNELGISSWQADFDQNLTSIKVKELINNNINNFFKNPLANTQVSAISFGQFESNGFLIATITFNGKKNGAIDNNMTGNIRIGKFKTNGEIAEEINKKIIPIINNLVKQQKQGLRVSEADMIFLVKQSIANATNLLAPQLPKKLFESGSISINDIDLQATYYGDGLNITRNVINRLGGIHLVTRNFSGESDLQYGGNNNKQWVIWVISASVVLFLIILVGIFYAYINRKKRLREMEWTF